MAKEAIMGAVIDMFCNRAMVRKNTRGWIAIVVENGRRVDYQFEREEWARKFAHDQRRAWSSHPQIRGYLPRTGR